MIGWFWEWRHQICFKSVSTITREISTCAAEFKSGIEVRIFKNATIMTATWQSRYDIIKSQIWTTSSLNVDRKEAFAVAKDFRLILTNNLNFYMSTFYSRAGQAEIFGTRTIRPAGGKIDAQKYIKFYLYVDFTKCC